MTRTWWNTLTALLWLAPAAIAIRYWMVWDRLPFRMATHFDADGRANGWMTRDVSLWFTLGFLTFVLTIFTFALYVVNRKGPSASMSWALLAFFYLEIWTVVYMLNTTLDYNIDGSPISILPLMIVTPVGILALLAITFGEKRGLALPPTDVVAEEVHSGKIWTVFFVIPFLAMVAAMVAIPNQGIRFGLALLGLIFVAVFGLAWDGFHYYFTRHGLEIRTMGFRLKSIPLSDIKQYKVEDWNALGGYGIRGVGNHKAYVWGSQGVRIQTPDGEIFLGHSDPERLVHDLDLIKQFAHS